MANTAWNPSDKGANVTLTGSNLIATAVSTGGNVRAVDKQITGKFYFEGTCNAIVAASTAFGVASSTPNLTSIITTAAAAGSCGVTKSGTIYVDGVFTGTSIAAITSGVVCVAYDLSNRLIWFRLGAAGNWNGSASANPATGAGGITVASLGIGIPAFPMAWLNSNGDAVTANFGDSAFTGTVPSGFTSGFTAGVTSSTNAIATQSAVEHWLTVNARAQVTQVALEQWATVTAAIPSTQNIGAMVLA